VFLGVSSPLQPVAAASLASTASPFFGAQSTSTTVALTTLSPMTTSPVMSGGDAVFDYQMCAHLRDAGRYVAQTGRRRALANVMDVAGFRAAAGSPDAGSR